MRLGNAAHNLQPKSEPLFLDAHQRLRQALKVRLAERLAVVRNSQTHLVDGKMFEPHAHCRAFRILTGLAGIFHKIVRHQFPLQRIGFKNDARIGFHKNVDLRVTPCASKGGNRLVNNDFQVDFLS